MPLDVVGIDLGHDQRHLGVHAEGVAVVDHDGAALDGLGQQLLRDVVARRQVTMSQPSKASGQASSITICSPRNSTVLPAERALASSLSLPTGNSCSLRHSSIWVPTAPVAPKIATVYCFMLPPLKVMAFACTPSRPIVVASVYKNGADTKPAPSKRNRNETPRRRFLRHDQKIYRAVATFRAQPGWDRPAWEPPSRRPSQCRSRRRRHGKWSESPGRSLSPQHR